MSASNQVKINIAFEAQATDELKKNLPEASPGQLQQEMANQLKEVAEEIGKADNQAFQARVIFTEAESKLEGQVQSNSMVSQETEAKILEAVRSKLEELTGGAAKADINLNCFF